MTAYADQRYLTQPHNTSLYSRLSVPFAGNITADHPACDSCTWVYRWIDGGHFALKFTNAWCEVRHG